MSPEAIAEYVAAWRAASPKITEFWGNQGRLTSARLNTPGYEEENREYVKLVERAEVRHRLLRQWNEGAKAYDLESVQQLRDVVTSSPPCTHFAHGSRPTIAIVDDADRSLHRVFRPQQFLAKLLGRRGAT